MNKLLIATNNQGKIDELQELLRDLNIKLITPADIYLDLDVIEDGLTYTENATKKAVAFAQASGLISLADDTGLEVDALDGAPGLYSKRYGSPSASLPLNPKDLGGAGGGYLPDAERRKYLISQLQATPRPWAARFRATIAIAIPANHVILSEAKNLELQQAETLRSPASTTLSLRSARDDLRVTHTEGICEGEIIPEDRGTNGFGYDPIFFFPELGKTMAELSMDEKNRLSHRARAVMNAKEILNELLG